MFVVANFVKSTEVNSIVESDLLNQAKSIDSAVNLEWFTFDYVIIDQINLFVTAAVLHLITY